MRCIRSLLAKKRVKYYGGGFEMFRPDHHRFAPCADGEHGIRVPLPGSEHHRAFLACMGQNTASRWELQPGVKRAIRQSRAPCALSASEHGSTAP
jgi:hypothetical protein